MDGVRTGDALVVAVDGPSGSGKSTVSRRLALALGTQYLDTGAMYRAVTWAVLESGIDPLDSDKVTDVARHTEVTVGTDPGHPSVTVNTTPVDGPIRGPAVTAAVSAVSAVSAVRRQLVARQRQIIEAARTGNGIVVEGRDIGTVVVPDATLKVFLTASVTERARRRSAEHTADLAATAADLARRDHLDSSRPVDPLAQAPDALVLDSTELGIDEVVANLVTLLQQGGHR